MGIDPLELRMKNLLDDGDTVMTGEPIEDSHFKELLAEATNWIGWSPGAQPERNGSTVRAKGFSCIIKGTVTPSTSTAAAKLNEDGSLDVLTSSVEMGQGLLTALAILGGEPLGIDVDKVHVSTPDTDVTPYDQQSSSSRSTYAMGTAVQRAVREIRRKLFEHASEILEVSIDDLELDGGRVVVKGVPERSLGLGEIVRKTRSGNIVGEATYITEGGLDPETGQGIGSVHWHQAAAAAEVEVDTDTGKVALLRYHAGVYAGRIINPVQAELQSEGNVAFGVGQALFEEMHFDNGQLQNGNLGDYMIASFEDLPRDLNVSVLEYLPADEIHGIGETGLPPVMPAIGNAIARATGVRIVDLPITPEKILRGLRELDARRSAAEEVPSR
jgi:CO/xanthine dehydrogenase Mo-binding subunit